MHIISLNLHKNSGEENDKGRWEAPRQCPVLWGCWKTKKRWEKKQNVGTVIRSKIRDTLWGRVYHVEKKWNKKWMEE